MAKNKISISFPEKKLYLYTYLKSKDNISNYMCNLIEADMNKDNADSDLEAKIQGIIDNLLKETLLTIDPSPENYNVIHSEENLTPDDIDIIKDLF